MYDNLFKVPKFKDGGNLNAEEINEIVTVSRYLREHAATEFKHLPEKSVNKVLNSTSPRVRQFLADSKAAAEFTASGARTRLFEKPVEFDRSTIDKRDLLTAEKSTSEEYSHALTERLGGVPDTTPAEPTLRDHLVASFDITQGADDGQ